MAGFQQLYFDSIVFRHAALRFLLELSGHHRVLLGSDFPLPNGDHQPTRVVEDASLDKETTEAILAGNARRLFAQ